MRILACRPKDGSAVTMVPSRRWVVYLGVTHLSQPSVCIVESVGFDNGSGLFDDGGGLAPCKGGLSPPCCLVVEASCDLDAIVCSDFVHGEGGGFC